MYATSLPPRPNPHARVAENYAPRFSPDELPLLPVNWIPSWRSPPSKIWGEVDEKGGDAGATAAASSYASAALSAARPQTTGWVEPFCRLRNAGPPWRFIGDMYAFPFSSNLFCPPRTRDRSIRFVRDSSAREMWGSLRDNCTGRLHATPVRVSWQSTSVPQYLKWERQGVRKFRMTSAIKNISCKRFGQPLVCRL